VEAGEQSIAYDVLVTIRPRATTLKDVARAAGVHPATASRALDPSRMSLVTPEKRLRVQQAAAELGYQMNTFARSLRKGASGMIGVVVADVGNPFLPPILSGVEQEIRTEGLLLLIAETHDDSATLVEILDHFQSRHVDALIVCAAHRGDAGEIRRVAQTVPVVLAVRSLEGVDLPTVTHDDFLGGQLAARHLVDLGHRDLAQLRGPADVSSFSGRAAGFESVLAASTARDVTGTDAAARTPTTLEGFRLALQFLEQRQDPPTALFAHNDLMAVGALDAIRKLGLRCPDDVSVVGYNDAPMSDHLRPSLTSVRLPGHDLGRRAAQMALALVQGGSDITQLEKLPPELIVRDSSGPVRT
jgi:LacI family transcriptional regulator